MSRESIRARLAAATPGPWKHRRGYPADRFHPEGYGYVQFGPTEEKAAGLGTDQLAKADAEFIAHAPTDLAALLAVADVAAAVVDVADATALVFLDALRTALAALEAQP